MLSRRIFLSGLLASTAPAAWAAAPERSLRPTVRPDDFLRRTVPEAADILEAANLSGRVGFAVADATTGEMLEVENPLYPLPPASVAKTVTSAYAMDRLGPNFRFRTRLVSDGVVADGRLDGDLWLVGSGDPLFDTDALAAMADALVTLGVQEVTGRFMVATGALPEIWQIDPDQLPHVGYNPAISALNLNFNRVHFGWERVGEDYTISMDARSASFRPAVQVARMRVEERSSPVYTYADAQSHDAWTVARGALGEAGSRWLPVRRPAAYTADVLQTLMEEHGVRLGAPEFAAEAPGAALVLAEHVSEPLEDILRGMMRWSTNLTAEVSGLLATQASGQEVTSLEESGAAMTAWMEETLGARNAVFVDHSGLGVDSRIRPQDMTHALVAAGPDGPLRGLMKDVPMRDPNGNVIQSHPVDVVGKTGTLSFVSALTGFARTPSGRDLAFTIFCADLDRRDAIPDAERERPPGARTYNGAAKRLQQALIERWGVVYD
ncbi:D-alanyl-D-alanine carboxypeptidase/D-alanyl-D-alanine endopeptidase [Gymnodinialimonas ceratoperidinii]|uniref:D-alanyl-D-alanine carboxypeptidase/D-alanyl-D-alanine-endopeptidase n=1 Tax=Gymnodinialimonas ceratoperidinii TaxID=2856823 RepID=A0A8F6TX55_9RHOB|nr:D-alanyl-D-alanine carboxypeptidase/D-alanyl-D-alanine-endopeptidase [Gymnodinialimonas ceratoperidinii]QXT40557.1 D-alanyl-D-alanine carboxypeptidase/D-alanyl-D-alanine-endopeptidase [Gymnodinialimonas ceratoperidinii]